MKRWILFTLIVSSLGLAGSQFTAPTTASSYSVDKQVESSGEDEDAALRRTRKQAKMLDTLYKTAIVIVTKNYVEESSDLAAGDAFQLLFQAMKDGGFHEVRLLDASGDPIDDDNVPKSDFEKAAVKAMLEGKPIYEEISEKEGKKMLRTVTPIPVVMDKCVMCHANYEGKGVIGALGITLPIE